MMKKLLVLASLILTSLIARPAAAQTGDAFGLNPFWDWKTIETEHFRVTYPKDLEPVANRAANYLEEAHSILSDKLAWTPRYKAQIVVVDNVDSANGLTTPVGRLGILLQVTPPEVWFGTEYYDDWLRLLCIHEYTHFLNMDATRGIWDATRYLFGDIFLPNALWPSWMLEGLAVYMETRYTHSGRGRSAYWDGLLRAAVEEGVLDNPAFITLDKVNGPNPYFPYGDTNYVFGYSLWNQVARTPTATLTHDMDSSIELGPPGHRGENVLGEASRRSSWRIPYFINGNLENIQGTTWYSQWDSLVEDTTKRAHADLRKIRSRPLTRTHKLTQDGQDTLGAAFSPDGRWMAFTQASATDEIPSLFLKDLSTGEISRIDEKSLGATLAFTPDSKYLFLSSLRRYDLYNQFSELGVYQVGGRNAIDYITHGLRAKDPDVSRDGKQITFTISPDRTNTVVVAPLLKNKHGSYSIGKIRRIFVPQKYDAAHTPKFSADGTHVYFSFHPNGKFSEDLMVADLRTGKITTLVSNGKLNRYPAVQAGSGEEVVYFVSDLTGVDNIYRLHVSPSGHVSAPELISNVTTGLAFPAIDSKGGLNANVLSTLGWNVAKLDPKEGSVFVPIDPKAVTIEPQPFPPSTSPEIEKKANPDQQNKVEDYSIFPSIWPRQWAPLFLATSQEVYAGGEILGFDALDYHSYLLGAAYDSFTKAPDLIALYGNRSLGVQLDFSTTWRTTSLITDANGGLVGYYRELKFTADASYPFKWTYSTLTATIGANSELDTLVLPNSTPNSQKSDPYVPYFDGTLTYNDGQASQIAISTEQGGIHQIASRLYLNSGQPVWKGLIRDTENFRMDWLVKHSVLTPTVAYSAVNDLSYNFLNANVVVSGRQTSRLFNSFYGLNLDQLPIRGYPLATFYRKQAGLASLDYKFPLWPIFRGWGTNPLFAEQLWGFVFGETTIFPTAKTTPRYLPSMGAGVNLKIDVFNNIPLILTTEYDKGFSEQSGGEGELFFQIGAQALAF